MQDTQFPKKYAAQLKNPLNSQGTNRDVQIITISNGNSTEKYLRNLTGKNYQKLLKIRIFLNFELRKVLQNSYFLQKYFFVRQILHNFIQND